MQDNIKDLKELVKILPENLRPIVSLDNVVTKFPGYNVASWEPNDPKLSSVLISWDDIEYVMTARIKGTNKEVNQIGTINLLETKAKKLEETNETIIE